MTKQSAGTFASAAGVTAMLIAIFVSDGSAQGTANVDVTVSPAYSAGQPVPARDGFLVCIGTASDRDMYGSQLTPLNGVANTAFRNLPAGVQAVATISKSGWTGMERTIALADGWNNHVVVNPQQGSGGPVCPAASGGIVPPAPAPAPAPAPVPATKTLVVTVLRASTRQPVSGATVCVGSQAGATDYGGMQRTGITGRVQFTIGAHPGAWATASALGTRGLSESVLLPREVASVSKTLFLSDGSGGPACPASTTFTLVVRAGDYATGELVAGATICVGESETSQATYGKQQTNGTTSNTFVVPRAERYHVIAFKTGSGTARVLYGIRPTDTRGSIGLAIPPEGRGPTPNC
jgi:hypothetical protein